MSDKCLKCGSPVSKIPGLYQCGSKDRLLTYTGYDCLRRQLAAEKKQADKAERRIAECALLDKTRCEQIENAQTLGAEDLGAADARFRKTEDEFARLKRAVRRAWSRSDRYGPVADGSPYAAGYYSARAYFLKAAEAAKETHNA